MRRRYLKQIAALLTAFTLPVTGFAMKKNNVRTLGKKFDYLEQPGLRVQEMGDAVLEIRNVEVSGAVFNDMAWRKIRFVECDFIGAYEIKADMVSVEFSDCRFAGVFNFGRLTGVDFVRCIARANTFVVGGAGSKGVRFIDCKFTGADANPNRWGGMGAYGENEFLRCKMKWANVISETRHAIVECEFDDVDCSVSSDSGGSEVLIERSRLRGKFDMRPSTLVSLTIRDTVLDELDMHNATVTGDVVMERVKAGFLKISIKEGARNFVLRDSQVYGDDAAVCSVYAGAFKSVMVENNVFGGGPGKRTGIGGGFEPDDTASQPVLTDILVFRNNTVPSLRSGRLNAAQVLIEGNTIGSLDLQQGRIGRLTLMGNTIARSVDFSRTQVGQSSVQSLAAGQAKLDGSNVTLK